MSQRFLAEAFRADSRQAAQSFSWDWQARMIDNTCPRANGGSSSPPGWRSTSCAPHAERERYVDEWLPEPIITSGHDDPARQSETVGSLSLAMLMLLDNRSAGQ